MAQHFCTGPAHIYVAPTEITAAPFASLSQHPADIQTIPNRVIQYLGTAEKQPRIVVDSRFDPVFNDLGGTMTPLDYEFQGEEAVVSIVFTRWNEAVLRRIRSLPTPGAIPGRNVNGDLGRFMGLEGGTYPLYVQFPYATKPVMAGMPLGYRFWAAYLQGPFEVMPGTTTLRKQLIFKCIRHFGDDPLTENPLTVNAAPLNSHLYDHNLLGLPALN